MAYEEVKNEVNATGMGGRTADQVRKQLTDQKAKTRAKAATINREMQKTGGGSAQCVTLSAIEELLLASMNPQTRWNYK